MVSRMRLSRYAYPKNASTPMMRCAPFLISGNLLIGAGG
jgi:hypothetical protein